MSKRLKKVRGRGCGDQESSKTPLTIKMDLGTEMYVLKEGLW